MRARLRRVAFVAAALLLAPALLCATGPRGISPNGRTARPAMKEGIRCFCHPAADGRGGAVRAPDAPSARALYLLDSANDHRVKLSRRLALPAASNPLGQPAPEPLVPPPLVAS